MRCVLLMGMGVGGLAGEWRLELGGRNKCSRARRSAASSPWSVARTSVGRVVRSFLGLPSQLLRSARQSRAASVRILVKPGVPPNLRPSSHARGHTAASEPLPPGPSESTTPAAMFGAYWAAPSGMVASWWRSNATMSSAAAASDGFSCESPWLECKLGLSSEARSGATTHRETPTETSPTAKSLLTASVSGDSALLCSQNVGGNSRLSASRSSGSHSVAASSAMQPCGM
mmetsp:Transcript_33085/g.65175  ORF Transcript_33085/g.65175 Transcript_33085/m.65175 type:complete len:230 (-) Transcript_33085:3031-3720(-)